MKERPTVKPERSRCGQVRGSHQVAESAADGLSDARPEALENRTRDGLGLHLAEQRWQVEERTQALHVLDNVACNRYRHTQVEIFDLVLPEVQSACGF